MVYEYTPAGSMYVPSASAAIVLLPDFTSVVSCDEVSPSGKLILNETFCVVFFISKTFSVLSIPLIITVPFSIVSKPKELMV